MNISMVLELFLHVPIFCNTQHTYKQSNAVHITGLLCVVLSIGFSKLLFLYFGIFRKCVVFMALDSSKE